jgi:voltage-dependent potassium channel beta subunit
MEYRKLGKAGIKVSVIGLGGWINFEAKIPTDEARRIVATAHENGINFYDLADVYGNGRAEEWLGGMLSEYPRHTLVIASKVFFPMSDDPNDRGLSRKHIMESIDRTLKRLGTDYLDVYFCHRADPTTPVYETARAMDDLIHQGKILYWGTSMWEPEQIEEAVDLCEDNGLIPPVVEQSEYSMLARQRVEEEILPVTRPRGIGLTVYSPLAQGMLTGKYDEGIPPGSRFDTEPWAKSGLLTDKNVEKVQALKMVAGELDVTRTQLALAWVLRQESVSSVISGVTKVGQLLENLGAVNLPLASDVIASIDRILDRE